MGAACWQYFIPWQADMNKALRELREDVFRSGKYERPDIGLELLDEIALFEVDESEREAILDRYGLNRLRPLIAAHGWDHLKASLEDLAAAPELRTMDELEVLMCFTYSGTHSILDVSRLTSALGQGGLYPLSEEQIQAIYGTPQPTRETIEAHGAVDGMYDRDEGFYFTTYRNGTPDTIFIEGCSGD